MPSLLERRVGTLQTLLTLRKRARRRTIKLAGRLRDLAVLLGIGRKAAYAWLAGLAALCAACVAVVLYLFPSPPSRIVIATAPAGTSYDQIARRYAEILARHKVVVEVRETLGSQENIGLLLDPGSDVDAAFVTGGVARRPSGRQLWSLGALFQSQLWIFYRAGGTWSRPSDLKGRKIAVGPPGSASRTAAERVLSRAGISAAMATLVDATGLAAAEALKRGQVDAVALVSDFDAPAVQALLRDDTVKLMSMPSAEAFTRVFPQLSHVVLPQGVLSVEPARPAADVSLLATTNRLLIRDDLHPAVVHLLLEAMVEVHGAPGIFHRAGQFPQGVDPEYPVAASAVDFYKNGPTFLQRNLPLWLNPLLQRVIALLLAVGAIAIPLATAVPKVFRWIVGERITKLYTRLHAIAREAERSQSSARLAELLREVRGIELECSRLPLPVRYADMYFTFAMHVELVRARLAGREQELRKSEV